MKSKAIVYPFDVQFEPVLRYRKLIEQYDIVGAVSPESWGLSGNDAAHKSGGSHIGVNVDCNFEQSLDLCDTVIFSDAATIFDFQKLIYPKIISAIKREKNIVLLYDIAVEIENEIKQKCEEIGKQFICYNSRNKFQYLDEYAAFQENIYDIGVPVVFVIGMCERTGKFETQLAMRDSLLNLGYKVSQIGTRSYCELLGFHSFPEFMFSTNIGETSKIVLFNRYVKEIEYKEKPDIIIIGLPGGIMPFNNYFTNKFGIIPFEVSQAVTPDAAILCTLYDDYKPDYFQMTSRSIRYKLGFEVDCFNLSNVMFDWMSAYERKKVEYTTVTSNFIDQKKLRFTNLNMPVYNILNSEDVNKMAEYIIDRLSNYGNARYI